MTHPIEQPPKNKRDFKAMAGKANESIAKKREAKKTHEQEMRFAGDHLFDVPTLEAVEGMPDKIAERAAKLEALRLKAPTVWAYNMLLQATSSEKALAEFVKLTISIRGRRKDEDSAEHAQTDDQRRQFRLWEALERDCPHLVESARNAHAKRKSVDTRVGRVQSCRVESASINPSQVP